MISWHPAHRKLGIIGVLILVFCLASAGPLLSFEDSPTAVVISVGLGAPPSENEFPDSPPGPPSALDDAAKKAVLSYLYGTLGREEFLRLENAVDTLILPEYPKYIEKTEIISVFPLPGGDIAVLKAAVTIDAAALAGYLENIKQLDAKPKAPRTLSEAEKEILISKAQAIYIQGEVASEILLDRLRGIESFLSAKTLFETAGSIDGVYRCLIGVGRARASLGDVSAARGDFDRALELARELKRNDYAAAARIARARLMAASGDPIGAGRETRTTLNDASLSAYDGLVGEALLIDAEIDYGAREYESAGIKAGRAVEIFERLADVKRLTQAQLLRGLVLIAEGDGAGAVAVFKLAKKLADRLDDEISADKALIGMSRGYRVAGDPKTASLYLTDALKTARDSGWTFGEIASLCETAYAQMDRGDPSAAEMSAADAHSLALSENDPLLTAASLLALGEVLRSLGKDEAAFEAFLSCIQMSLDIRVVGRDVPFLFFEDARRDTALSGLLALSIELGREKKVLEVIAGYEGSGVAREVLYGPPPLPGPEAELAGLFRDAAGRAIATDGVSLGGDFLRTADTSRAETARLGNEARRSLSDIETRIARESPRLAALMGIKNPDPGDLERVMPDGSALVHYVVNGGGAFAVIVTGRTTSIVRLDGRYEEISTLAGRLREAVGAIGGTTAGTYGEIPLAFTEPSTALTSDLVSPILSELTGVTTIGISPPAALASLPIRALGRYNDEGQFIFLGEEYTLFGTSWLYPRVAGFTPSRPGPVGYDVIVVADADLPGLEDVGSLTETETPDGGNEAQGGPNGDEGPLRIVRYSPGSPWRDVQARLAIFPEKGIWGSSDFSGFEYLCFMSHMPVMVIPDHVGPDALPAFLRATIAASAGGTVLRGYADAVKTSVPASGSVRPVDWILCTLISDFVSEQK